MKLFRAATAGDVEWQNRKHFYCVAARAMRQIIIEHARKRNANIRGNNAVHVPLELELIASRDSGNLGIDDVIAVGEILRKAGGGKTA